MDPIKNLDKRFCEPSGFKVDYFKNADNKSVRYGHVKPKGKSKGAVVMTTGYADFIESYFETMHDYLDRGYEIWIMDWAGQGGSERYNHKKPWIPNASGIEDNVRDLYNFRQNVVQADKNKPIILSTHSMGGHIAMHYLHKHHNDFDKAVLVAPFIGAQNNTISKMTTFAYSKLMVAIGRGNRPVVGRDCVIKHIKALRKKYEKDEPIRMRIHQYHARKNPSLRIGNPTHHWLSKSFKSVAKLNKKEYLSKVKTSVLIVGAAKDGLVDNTYARRAILSMPNGRYVEIKDASHGLWTERKHIRDAMWRHIDKFIEPKNENEKKYSAGAFSSRMRSFYPHNPFEN